MPKDIWLMVGCKEINSLVIADYYCAHERINMRESGFSISHEEWLELNRLS